ncbi:endonuclease/exonuclease/phosphatase family metal-dependent hydrolase [Asanoa ferruginea]|uniref:Endonuclease/exonuclease/phosphatase family metal-dependent hydrolase n=1 Tax=Asanoa ferruginea TaxID=53367 RepID=A0A3D9ZLL4_9ACTN|nr:endonuclease/exonuclease/phosphatase family metal-dependent hydrolase [Asanoa ferruginea]GIF50919.1 endonuclease [Asanoa ferruginea]
MRTARQQTSDVAPDQRGRSVAAAVACWLAVAPGVAWTAIRLGGWERGPLVQLIAYTPYTAGLTVVPLIGALALRRWRAAAVAALSLAALAGVVLPRALPAGAADTGGPRLRVLTANVKHGEADPAALVRLVREHHIDVLAVQELNTVVIAGLDAAGIGTLLPHRIVNDPTIYVNGGLYSRVPLTGAGIHQDRSGFTQAYATVTLPGAAPLVVESVHSCAPLTVADVPCWFAGLRGQSPATPDGPIRLLMGDFNATVDHQPMRALLDTGYDDAAIKTGHGLKGTWRPIDRSFKLPPIAIDHILIDPRVAVREFAVWPLPGSDHSAVFAEVSLPPS